MSMVSLKDDILFFVEPATAVAPYICWVGTQTRVH